MSETRQSAILLSGLLILIFGMELVILGACHSVAARQQANTASIARLITDNEIIAMLRADLARTKGDQRETEAALDREALENLRLRDEVHLLRLNAELRKERKSL